jgi:hypothetical protein
MPLKESQLDPVIDQVITTIQRSIEIHECFRDMVE